jgi:hypothetical protein
MLGRRVLHSVVAVTMRMILVLLALANIYCSFVAADNAPPDPQVDNATTRLGVTGSFANPVFPLRVSANNRYLVDQNDVPFLMVGDSPQALIGNLSPMEAAVFINNRRRHGINALWINLLCNDGTGCNADGSTVDGITPFTTPNDLSASNPTYFERADSMIKLAGENGIAVLLNPIETIGWLRILRANGTEKAFSFGQYLGNRYKNSPNIIWMHGNDFQT